jgi:hypothetical protein
MELKVYITTHNQVSYLIEAVESVCKPPFFSAKLKWIPAVDY